MHKIIAKLSLNQAALPTIDAEFEEITEGEDQAKKQQLKTKWAAQEAMVGDPMDFTRWRSGQNSSDGQTHLE